MLWFITAILDHRVAFINTRISHEDDLLSDGNDSLCPFNSSAIYLCFSTFRQLMCFLYKAH